MFEMNENGDNPPTNDSDGIRSRNTFLVDQHWSPEEVASQAAKMIGNDLLDDSHVTFGDNSCIGFTKLIDGFGEKYTVWSYTEVTVQYHFDPIDLTYKQLGDLMANHMIGGDEMAEAYLDSIVEGSSSVEERFILDL